MHPAVGATAAGPRLVVAGLSGESGKTLVALALLLNARRQGHDVRAFKKGPDYIDAAWLAWASGAVARNLDTYLMGFEDAVRSFSRHAIPCGLNLIEGNRGLYDGVDALGTHSTAELAKALRAPVVVVVNATKMTRTAAALLLGCERLDPEVTIAGVIFNQVAGSRHERLLRAAVESACHVPVLGAIPRAEIGTMLPSRHLGLVTPLECPGIESLAESVLDLTGEHLDFDRLLEIARQVPALEEGPPPPSPSVDGRGLVVGYFADSAFSFYYPENLDALRCAGARLAPISALSAQRLPSDLDALYIGGGFPETHAEALSQNSELLGSVRRAAEQGLPVYAECGGLMYLSRALHWRGRRYPLAAALPFEVEMCSAPQGHGYVELLVDAPNPFFPTGTRLRGHEFHYSRITCDGVPPSTACAVLRGTGCCARRDAVIAGHTWAAYTHLHALATPEWAAGLLGAARIGCAC